jgi:hypothetical protein
MKPLEFANFTVSDIHSQQGASNLMSEKLSMGENEPSSYEFLATNFVGNRLHIETVNEYRAGIKAGYAPYTTFDMTMESWFVMASDTLGFMAKAQPSQHSYLDLDFLKQLPGSVLDLNTNGDWGHIHGLKIKGNTATFSDDACDYCVEEVARGDFDRDGCEDSLVFISTYYRGGSGRSYQSFVVSKSGPKQRLKLTRFDAVDP